MLAEIFDFLSDPDVIHKVALVSKRVREILIKNRERLNFKVTFKVGPLIFKPKISQANSFFEDDNDHSPIFDRLGVNWEAYKAILKMANRVRLVCTDENYVNIL
jgi:hypothetical protein